MTNLGRENNSFTIYAIKFLTPHGLTGIQAHDL
jgi:hypothetical protein